MITAILREAMLSARAQPLASIVTAVFVATMCIAVLLTQGRANGNQQAVLSTIDSAGTRSITVRATPEAGLTSTILDSFSGIDGIETVVALGSAQDVRNAGLPDGTPVPLRDYWGSGLGMVGQGEAIASAAGLHALGMQTASGAVVNANGIDVAVVGMIPDASILSDYEPLLLTPRAAEDIGEIGVLVIVTTDATVVTAVAEVIRPIVTESAKDQVMIETSQGLATLRGSINEQLGAFGVMLTAGTLVIAGVLVAIVQTALILLKRKDWGRRRALGASRSLVTWLIVTQTGIISLAGVGLGMLAAYVTLAVLGDPLPSAAFATAVAILATALSMFASLVPALVASRRDPIKELRVP